jgi:DNA invertase Pin-like site-specific DNA recombinase
MGKIGYARVSTEDQTVDPQLDALNTAGCDRIFSERASGALRARPELDAALDYIRSGDTLVVTKLDRLGRSLPHLIDTLTGLDERGVGFHSISEGIDTTTSAGRLMMHILGAIAQFERDLIIERTRAGLAAAKARGRTGGRPSTITPEKLAVARQMHGTKTHTMAVIAETIGVSRATLYRHLGAEAA